MLWAFSIYLEAIAILPQLVLLQRSGNVDNLAVQYVFFLGCDFFFTGNCLFRMLIVVFSQCGPKENQKVDKICIEDFNEYSPVPACF